MPDWGWLVGVVIALAALWPFVRAKSTASTIELLRSELGIERDARVAQEKRCTAELAEERTARASEVSELRGRLQTVNESFARVIAAEVVAVLRRDGVIT